MAFDSTVSGATANSYISLAEASEYFEGRLYTTSWDDASYTDREKALRYATTELDRMAWKGTITDPDVQALRFPRTGLYDLDGNLLAADEIPTFLIDATSELAISLLEGNRYAENESVGLKKVKAAEVEVEFDSKWQNSRNTATVTKMINPYLLYSSDGNYTLLMRA